MTWDITQPGDKDSIKAGDDAIVANWIAFQGAFDDTHVFSGSTITRGKHYPGLTPVVKVGTTTTISAMANISGGLAFVSDMGGFYYNTGAAWSQLGPFTAGDKMLFIQATAPLGWEISGDVDGGIVYATSTEANGGSSKSGGNWTISGVSQQHYHRYNEIKSHTHTETMDYAKYGDDDEDGVTKITMGNGIAYTGYTNYTGSSTGNTSTSSDALTHAGTWRPKRVFALLCVKL